MTSSFEERAEEAVPAAEIYVFSAVTAVEDEEAYSNVVAVQEDELPDPTGKSGGACTSALLNVLYDHHKRQQQFPY